jgi:predicted neuraminidase
MICWLIVTFSRRDSKMDGVKRQEFVFEEDRAFSSCHASTHVHLSDGGVLAAWFAGTKEGAPDVAIWMSRRGKDGAWAPPEVAADESGVPHWNPVLFQGIDRRIILYYKTGRKISSWSTKFIESHDEGVTWSAPRELIADDRGGRGPVKNKPILLRSGRILAPASSEGEEWNAFVDISDDDGRSWTKSATVPLNRPVLSGKGVIQPTLWELESGAIGMLLRSTAGWIIRSTSEDGGETWSTGELTPLPNNNSGIDLAKSSSSVIALAYNPVGKDWGARTPLDVVFSCDDGASWEGGITLESAPGEYSYPAVLAQGSVFSVTYTWKRERIAYAEIEQ